MNRDTSDTLGPLARKLFELVWEKMLFVPGSSLYLPDIIKNGDPSKGLISYDPYNAGGASSPIEVNVPQASRCTACLSLDTPNPPVGKGRPTLVLENIDIINLRAIDRDGALSFPPGYKVGANFLFGMLQGQALPLTIQTRDTKRRSYTFRQNCCETATITPGQCADERIANSVICIDSWINEGTGTFTAKIARLSGKTELTVDVSNLTVSNVDKVEIGFLPSDISYDFNVDQSGGDLGKEAMMAFVKAAIETGIAQNLVQNMINTLAGGQDFRDNIKKLINAALAEIIKSEKIAGRLSARD